ncbi:MAG: hypothetical protein ABSH08_14835 [Tepidisphaeraceae bacterium]
MRKRIAVIFLLVALVVWSRAWQRVAIRIDLFWLRPYATNLYCNVPLSTPMPGPQLWKGAILVQAVNLTPTGVQFKAGFGTLVYLPNAKSNPWIGILEYDETTYSEIAPGWWVERPAWNYFSPFGRSLYR